MKLAQLRQKLAAEFHHAPQQAKRAELALAEIESGLGHLAQIGHLFHLESGPAQDLDEWPKLLFHVDSAPNGRLVHGAAEAFDLGGPAEGWYPTLSEAQHADGTKTQFAGRGGVSVRSLPMVIPGEAPTHAEAPDVRRSRIVEEFKRRTGFGKI